MQPLPMIEWVSGKEFRNLNFNVENWGKIMQIILSFYKDVQLYGLLYNLKIGRNFRKLHIFQELEGILYENEGWGE